MGLGDPAPTTVRVCLVGEGEGTVEIRAGGAAVTAELTTTPMWHEVPVVGDPIDVVNNAGSILTPDGYGADRGYLDRDDGEFDEPTDVFAWCGAAVVLSSRYLADVGLLDERLFLYYEDLELSWRGRERGWRYRYVPDSVVRHVHSATTGEHSSLARYQNERNHLVVLARDASPGTTLRAAGRSVLITASYARRDVLSPMLRRDKPRTEIVRDRARAFSGFVRLVPSDGDGAPPCPIQSPRRDPATRVSASVAPLARLRRVVRACTRNRAITVVDHLLPRRVAELPVVPLDTTLRRAGRAGARGPRRVGRPPRRRG